MLIKKLLGEAGLTIVKEEKQGDFPKEIFAVYMYGVLRTQRARASLVGPAFPGVLTRAPCPVRQKGTDRRAGLP